MKYRDFVKMLRENDWQIKSQQGSHQHWVYATRPGKVTVAGHPNDDIPPGTLKSMMKQAGLK